MYYEIYSTMYVVANIHFIATLYTQIRSYMLDTHAAKSFNS